jgi:hypothetical protein
MNTAPQTRHITLKFAQAMLSQMLVYDENRAAQLGQMVKYTVPLDYLRNGTVSNFDGHCH